MDSINRNQTEENRKDLGSGEAISKIKELIEDSKSCFFCTCDGLGKTSGVRPMSVQKVDDSGNLLFLSASDSHKNQEISDDRQVKLYFQGSSHSEFLYLAGTAEVSFDRELIRELWEPVFKTWFTEGVNDPRISVIKVKPEDGYYWDTKHGNFVAGIKMLFGAAVGKTFDDSLEGALRV